MIPEQARPLVADLLERSIRVPVDFERGAGDPAGLALQINDDPEVRAVEIVDNVCTAEGWDRLTVLISRHRPNRVVIGASDLAKAAEALS